MDKISEICRICLESDPEEMHKIFDECLNNKIVILTGLDLLPSDQLPKMICRNCRYQLEKSFHFRLMAKQSDTRLRKYVRLVNQKKNADHVLEKGFKDDDIEEFDESISEAMRYFDDVKQQIEVEKQKVIAEELQKLHAESTKPKSPKKLPIKPQKSPSKDIVILNKCPTPSKPLVAESVRRKPKKAEKVQNVEEFKENPIEIVHIDNGEYEIEIIETEVSDEVEGQFVEYPQYEVISEEQVEVKRKQKFEADEPQEQSVVYNYCNILRDDENPELDENGEKKIFKCAFKGCKETFSRRQQCKTHFYNHLATGSNYTCRYCEKKFKVASALERHERVHTNAKPFICETCNKGFSQKEMLKRHIMIHLPKDEAPFECKICNEKFRQKDPLRQHMRRAHSDGKVTTYDCTFCGKSFAHSSGLSRHLLIHSGKIFTCEICSRQFTDKSALKRHEGIHSMPRKTSQPKKKKVKAEKNQE